MLIARGEKLGGRLAIVCVLLSLLPDADVIGFAFGIPYASAWGHRGFTHSLSFALLAGLIASLFFQEKRRLVFFLAAASTFSHPLMDMLTDGGLGVALWWPFDTSRYFFPIRPVAVSPLGIGNFIGRRGVMVLGSEVLFLWLPILVLGFLIKKVRG